MNRNLGLADFYVGCVFDNEWDLPEIFWIVFCCRMLSSYIKEINKHTIELLKNSELWNVIISYNYVCKIRLDYSRVLFLAIIFCWSSWLNFFYSYNRG